MTPKRILRTRRWKAGDIQGITPSELQAMIQVASKNDRHAKRNVLMLHLGFAFGLRVSELLELRIEDVDLDNGQVHLARRKNGKEHYPELTRALERNLRTYVKERGGKPADYLFPSQWNTDKPIRRQYFHKWFAKTAQAAGLPVAKQHPHALRHGLGFTMSAAGHNPQAIGQALGHRSARMALQFYGQVNDAVADAARKDTFKKYSWL